MKKLNPERLTQVEITDAFWSPKLRVNRDVTIPTVYQRCKETGRIDAWKLAWKPGLPHEPHLFWDSDVAKWIEAAAHSLTTHPDPKLEAALDDLKEISRRRLSLCRSHRKCFRHAARPKARL